MRSMHITWQVEGIEGEVLGVVWVESGRLKYDKIEVEAEAGVEARASTRVGR